MNKKGKGRLIVVSAPSGAGKTTVVKDALERLDDIAMSVSWTTRKPREGEIDGKDYRFVTRKSFEDGIRNGNFIEWASVFDEYYGTPSSNLAEAKKSGLDLFLVIDVQGGAQIKEKVKGSTLIFLMPPSMDDLRIRLLRRGKDDREHIEKRLKEAKREIDSAKNYDFRIVNDDLEKAVDELVKAVICIRESE